MLLSAQVRAVLFIVVLFSIVVRGARGQSCPKEDPAGPLIDSSPQTLSGKIVYHDEIRQWFELRLAQPVCGQTIIQLIGKDESLDRTVQTLRGCSATVQGLLGLPGTGYYSAAIYQQVDQIEPAPDCVRRLPFPDYSKLKPSKSLRLYRVSMWFDYTKQDSHVHVTIANGTHFLEPWQPYASYYLTGGFGFYGRCADGFDLVSFNGTPEAKPWLIDNAIALDPEGAAAKHVDHIRLAFTCRRELIRSGAGLSR
jgi:hypothetical protein